jgi:hypothetical protein
VKRGCSHYRSGSNIFGHCSHTFLNEAYISEAVVSNGGSGKYIDFYAPFEWENL